MKISPPILALLLISCPVQAAITVHTNAVGFQNASTVLVTDTFSTLRYQAYAGLNRSVGGYDYTISSGPGTPFLYGGRVGEDGFVSINAAADTITLSGFSGGVTGIAGNFFGGDGLGGVTALATIELTIRDADGSVTYTLTDATKSSFLGFTSDKPILSLDIRIPGANSANIRPALDNLILAHTVPEPSHAMLAGLGLVGLLARRRRNG